MSRIEVWGKFCFRTVTLKELYDAIDSLDNNKCQGAGVFNAWAIKAAIEPICSLFLTHALVKIFSQKI